MPYPKRLLNDGEELHLDLRPHWWYFAHHIFTGVPLLVALLVIESETHGDVKSLLRWVWGVATLVWAVFHCLGADVRKLSRRRRMAQHRTWTTSFRGCVVVCQAGRGAWTPKRLCVR